MILIIIALIVVYFIVKENKKNTPPELVITEENAVKFCGRCGNDLRKRVGVKYCPECGNYLYRELLKKEKEKNKLSKEDTKNLLILIAGSVLIVLAAVVFLTSTWGVTHSLVKSLIIFLLLGFFYGASYISKKTFNLNFASKTFLYLANAYLPFALLSVLTFGLLGESFESGPLYYSYLAITFIICSSVYKIIDIKSKDSLLAIASIIFDMFAIMSFVSIFSDSGVYLYGALFLYSVFLAILYYFEYYIHSEKIMRISIITLSSISFVIYLLQLLFAEPAFTYILLSSVMFIGGMFLIKKVIKNDIIFKIFYPIMVFTICGLTCNTFELPFVMEEVVFIIGGLTTLFIDYVDCKTVINVFNYVLTTIIFIFMYFEALDTNELVLKAYLVSLIFGIFSFLDFSFSKKNSYFVMFLIALEITVLTLGFDLYDNYLLGLAGALVIYLLSYVKEVSKFKNIFHNLGIILLMIVTLLLTEQEFLIISFGTLLIMSAFMLAKHILNENYNKHWLLYLLILSTFMILSRILVDYNVYLSFSVISMGVWLILLLGTVSNRFKNNTTLVFGLVSYAFTILIGVIEAEIEYAWLYQLMPIFNSLMLVAYVSKYKEKNALLYFPLLGLLVAFRGFGVHSLTATIGLIITAFVITSYSVKKENKNLRVLPYLYTLVLYGFSVSNYIVTGMAIFITIIYLMVNKNSKLYQILLELLVLKIYYDAVNDLGLTSAVVYYGILLPAIMVFTRYIYKNTKGMDIVEYILLILVSLIAMSQYGSTFEGLLFVGLLALLMVSGYIYKYEPAFNVSLVAVIINVLLLTYKYLLNLPGWLYLLILGLAIVMFAVYNENKNKNKKNKE